MHRNKPGSRKRWKTTTKKLKTEDKSAVWSGNRVRDNGMYMDADGKLMAHCAEKSQEGPVDTKLPETGKERLRRPQPGGVGEGPTCKGNKTALAAIPPWSVITGAVGLRAAALFSWAVFPQQLDICITSQSLFRLGDWMMTREVKH